MGWLNSLIRYCLLSVGAASIATRWYILYKAVDARFPFSRPVKVPDCALGRDDLHAVLSSAIGQVRSIISPPAVVRRSFQKSSGVVSFGTYH